MAKGALVVGICAAIISVVCLILNITRGWGNEGIPELVENVGGLKDIATVFGFPIAAVVMGIGAWQLYRNVKVASGTFMLELERMSYEHKGMYLKFWEAEERGEEYCPEEKEEWLEVYDYMGFLEYCEILVREGSIKLGTIKDMFGHRIEEIMDQSRIVEKTLGKMPEYWVNFMSLAIRLGLGNKIPKEGMAVLRGGKGLKERLGKRLT